LDLREEVLVKSQRGSFGTIYSEKFGLHSSCFRDVFGVTIGAQIRHREYFAGKNIEGE